MALSLLAPAVLAASTDTWVGGSGSSFSTVANWTYSSGSGPVASGDSLLFTGAGSLTPNNDLTGATFNGIGFSGTALYTVSGNAFTLGSGGAISNTASVTQILNNNIVLTGSGGTISPTVASASCAITLGGVISGSANLTKGGGSGSVLTLSGANTFSGTLTFNTGTVNFTTPPSPSGGNLGNPSGITFGGGSTTTLVTTPGAGSVTISYPTITTASSSSTAQFKNGAAANTTFEVSAKITGAGNCKQASPTTSSAVVRFSNDSSDFAGNFAMGFGIVEFTSVANAGTASALGQGSSAYAIANSASAATFRYVGPASSSTTRSIDWQGTTGQLSLDNTGSGSVQFLGSGNLRSGTGGSTTLNLIGSSTGANTLGQVINDNGTTSLSKSGTGTWVLSGVNSYSGATTISAGALQLSGSGTLGASAGALTLSGGTLDLGGTSQTKGAVTLSGASALQNGTLSGASFSATLASGTATVGANLAGNTAALSLSGAGTLGLFGANTYGGGTTLGAAGTLLLTNDAGLGAAGGGLTFNASGILAATNNGAGANNPVTIGAARTITVSSSGVSANFFTPDTNNLIVAAKITGPGNVIKKSSSFALGTVRFSNDSSDYTGDFTAGYGNTECTSVADQGTPSSLGAGAVTSGGQISLNNGSSSGTLRYVGASSSTTHRPLNWTGAAGYTLEASGAGSVQYLATAALRSGAGGAVTLVLRGTNTEANTLAQTIADLNGNTSLTKNDAGTWALSGANTYSGPTTLNAGTLLINGSLAGAGAVSVQNSATLGGSGTVAGVVTVNPGGTLAPGASAGTATTLTLQATPVLNGALVMGIRKSGSSLTADQLALGANTLVFGGTLTVTASGDALAVGDTLHLFNAASYSGSFSTITLPTLGTGLGWDTSSLGVDGTIRVLSLGSAPTVVVLPASTNIECGGSVSFATASTGSPAPTFQWYDNHGNAVPNATGATLVLTNVHAAQSGSWAVVASNSQGAATNSALLAVSDTTPPAIVCPSDISIVTTDPVGATVSFIVTATDTCDSAPTLVTTPASGSFFAAGTNTVVTTATDSSGNTNTCSFRVLVDRAPSVLTNLSAVLAQDTSLSLELTNLLSVVTDLDSDPLSLNEVDVTSTNGGSVTLTSTNVIYQPLAGFSGSDLFSYVVADGRGGLATNTVAVNVLSTNEFIVSVTPATTNAECASSVTFSAQTAATAPVSFQWYDNAGNSIADATNATLTLAGVHAAQNGSWTVVMTTAFTQATHSASLTVVDTTAPVITLNGSDPMVVEAGTQFTDPGATALDACVGPVTVTVSGTVNVSQPGGYTLAYTADDGGGNVSHATRTVNVVDTTPPVIVYYFTNLNLSATATNCQALLPDLTGTNYFLAVDGVSSSVTVTQAPPAGTWLSLGTNRVVLTAVDASGNTVDSTNTVVVEDTTPPALTLLGAAALTNECHAPFTDPGVLAEDSCSGVVSVLTNGLVNADVLGIYTLEYVATDASGNTATNTRTVYVVDTTAPVITCPSDIALVTTDPVGASVSFTVTATDTVDAAPVVLSTPASGSFFPAGTNTVVSTATDASGNVSTCSFLVVVDRAPVAHTNVVAYVAQNQTLTLNFGQLLAVVSDLDNDPLSVASADASSANAGSVQFLSTALTYLPATNYLGADQFSYTISDGRGGLATNSVVVSIVSSNALSPTVVYGPVVTNGQFVVRYTGVPGYTYTVEATTNLFHPVWSKVSNLTASPTDEGAGLSSFEFRDDSTAADRKFYRTVYPAY